MIRAKDTVVARVFQAQCRVLGCNWRGTAKNSYEAANTERFAHLDGHRQKENGGKP